MVNYSVFENAITDSESVLKTSGWFISDPETFSVPRYKQCKDKEYAQGFSNVFYKTPYKYQLSVSMKKIPFVSHGNSMSSSSGGIDRSAGSMGTSSVHQHQVHQQLNQHHQNTMYSNSSGGAGLQQNDASRGDTTSSTDMLSSSEQNSKPGATHLPSLSMNHTANMMDSTSSLSSSTTGRRGPTQGIQSLERSSATDSLSNEASGASGTTTSAASSGVFSGSTSSRRLNSLIKMGGGSSSRMSPSSRLGSRLNGSFSNSPSMDERKMYDDYCSSNSGSSCTNPLISSPITSSIAIRDNLVGGPKQGDEAQDDEGGEEAPGNGLQHSNLQQLSNKTMPLSHSPVDAEESACVTLFASPSSPPREMDDYSSHAFKPQSSPFSHNADIQFAVYKNTTPFNDSNNSGSSKNIDTVDHSARILQHNDNIGSMEFVDSESIFSESVFNEKMFQDDSHLNHYDDNFPILSSESKSESFPRSNHFSRNRDQNASEGTCALAASSLDFVSSEKSRNVVHETERSPEDISQGISLEGSALGSETVRKLGVQGLSQQKVKEEGQNQDHFIPPPQYSMQNQTSQLQRHQLLHRQAYQHIENIPNLGLASKNGELVSSEETPKEPVHALIIQLLFDNLEVVRFEEPTIGKNGKQKKERDLLGGCVSVFRERVMQESKEAVFGRLSFHDVCSYKLGGRNFRLCLYVVELPIDMSAEAFEIHMENKDPRYLSQLQGKVIGKLISPSFTIRAKKPTHRKKLSGKKRKESEEPEDPASPERSLEQLALSPFKRMKIDDTINFMVQEYARMSEEHQQNLLSSLVANSSYRVKEVVHRDLFSGVSSLQVSGTEGVQPFNVPLTNIASMGSSPPSLGSGATLPQTLSPTLATTLPGLTTVSTISTLSNMQNNMQNNIQGNMQNNMQEDFRSTHGLGSLSSYHNMQDLHILHNLQESLHNAHVLDVLQKMQNMSAMQSMIGIPSIQSMTASALPNQQSTHHLENPDQGSRSVHQQLHQQSLLESKQNQLNQQNQQNQQNRLPNQQAGLNSTSLPSLGVLPSLPNQRQVLEKQENQLGDLDMSLETNFQNDRFDWLPFHFEEPLLFQPPKNDEERENA